MSTPKSHRIPFMKEALKEAEKAASEGEIPIGCVAVMNGKIIAADHNRKEQLNDPTAHAEILVLRKAGEFLGTWHLCDVDLYVTLEPCIMCASALTQARIKTLIYGASEPKTGGVRSLYAVCEDPRINHNPEVIGGILKEESEFILKKFFESLRVNKL